MIKQKTIIIICLLTCFMISEIRAQDQSIGQLQRIIEVENGKAKEIQHETDRVRIQRGEWINAKPEIDLFSEELIQMKKDMRADIQIDRLSQAGNIYLAPDSPVAFHSIKEEGIYRISDAPEKLGGFKLLVVKGSLICDWLYGVLRVDLAGFSVDISGTRVVFVVDESGDEAIIFLQEGSIRFPEFPELKVNAMDVLALKRGQDPVKYDPNGSQLEQLEKFLEFNVEDVWSNVKPWWQKPIFYIPAIAVVTTASGILLSGGKDANGNANGDGNANGNVIITIPF